MPGSRAAVRAAIGVPNLGPFGDPSVLVRLAEATEQAGWDGFFVWDHLLPRDPAWPAADPQVVIAAAAARTERIRLGILIIPLARRRPSKVAKEIATLDHLSGGRMVLGAGLGATEAEWSALGEDPDARVRAARLDEGLDVIAGLLQGERFSYQGAHEQVDDVVLLPPSVQRPRVPIWVGGRWPNRAPFRRAARWDGIMPVHADYGAGTTMPPEDLADVVGYVADNRPDGPPFDVAIEGRTEGSPETAGELVAAYAAVGLTWWIEALGWWRGNLDAAHRRIEQGPPRVS